MYETRCMVSAPGDVSQLQGRGKHSSSVDTSNVAIHFLEVPHIRFMHLAPGRRNEATHSQQCHSELWSTWTSAFLPHNWLYKQREVKADVPPPPTFTQTYSWCSWRDRLKSISLQANCLRSVCVCCRLFGGSCWMNYSRGGWWTLTRGQLSWDETLHDLF